MPKKAATSKLDRSAGVEDAHRAVPLIVMRANRNIRDALDNITKAEPERRQGALDELVRLLERDPMRWAEVYEVADYLREQEDYWRAEGYEAFEDFWRHKASTAFASLKELEEAYNYAALACPDLFNMDWLEAKTEAGQIAKLRSVRPAQPNGVNVQHAKSRSGELQESEALAKVQAGGRYVSKGTNTFERRVAKIKRDRPDIYADMEAGRYFRKTGSGAVTIDLIAAERDAYGDRPKKKSAKQLEDAASRNVRRAIEHIRKVSKSSTARGMLIEELKATPWIVKALSK